MVHVVLKLRENKRKRALLDEVAAVDFVGFLIQVAVFFEEPRDESSANPRQELLFNIAVEESELLQNVFVELAGKLNLQFLRELLHELSKAVNVFAVLVLDGQLKLRLKLR